MGFDFSALRSPPNLASSTLTLLWRTMAYYVSRALEPMVDHMLEDNRVTPERVPDAVLRSSAWKEE